MFGHERGTCEGQQVFELLGLLGALRLWLPLWKRERVKVHVRSDNIGFLFVVFAFEAPSSLIAAVARKLALDLR